MASHKHNIIKRRGVPLNVVTVSSSKRTKVQRVKSSIRSQAIDVQESSDSPYETYGNYDDNCEYNVDADQATYKRKLKASERWQAIEDLAIDAVICSMGRPSQDCGACGAPGIVRCYDCGPSSLYCEDCAIEIHRYQLFHHFMEIWQVISYIKEADIPYT